MQITRTNSSHSHFSTVPVAWCRLLGAAALLCVCAMGGCGMFGEGGGRSRHGVRSGESGDSNSANSTAAPNPAPLLAPSTGMAQGVTQPVSPTLVDQRTNAYVARINQALQNSTQPAPAAQGGFLTSAPVKRQDVRARMARGGAVNAKGPGGTVLGKPATPVVAGTSTTQPVASGQGVPASTAFPKARPGGKQGPQAMASMTAATGGAGALIAPPKVAPRPPERTLKSVLALLRKRTLARPQILQYALALNLLDSIAKAKAAPAKALAQVNKNDRKVIVDITKAIGKMVDHAPINHESIARQARPLIRAARAWAAHASLSLPRLTLCSRVDSFGVYTPVADTFRYGKRHTVIIYCEVSHFEPRKTSHGWYVTRLTQQDTLMTNDGLLIWRPNPEDVEDRSMDRRHDFYLVKKMTIPDDLAVGSYTLRMSVTDRNTHQIAQADLPVKIVGK